MAATSPHTHSPVAQKYRRSNHTRTNASLTSSIGSNVSTSYSGWPSARSTDESSRFQFEATGFDPMRTEPDTLFLSLNVREVERYERAVRSAALEKQQELRRLVGQRYEDLLGTANTIIDMASSSSQLAKRLDQLSRSTERQTNTLSDRKSTRRSSYLLNSGLDSRDRDGAQEHTEAIYVLGASLKLIMDAPEFVWKSIEKGKTLQAAWAFMLSRAAWWELIEKQSTSIPSPAYGDTGVSSVSEAVLKLGINVKQGFPFIEKQWQSMIPMRKQIVHRAVSLLADSEIEDVAVADQLAALMLIDGTKMNQAFSLLLAQRHATFKRILHRGASALSIGDANMSMSPRRRPSVGFDKRLPSGAPLSQLEKSSILSKLLIDIIKLLGRTLQHACQLFIVPYRTDGSSGPQPFLIDLLTTVLEHASKPHVQDPTQSPVNTPASLPGAVAADAAHKRQDAAALRAAKRRSSYGIPAMVGSSIDQDCTTAATPVDQPKPRVSTNSVLQALPSAQILLRLLPRSIWTFTPYIEQEDLDSCRWKNFLDELCDWSTKTRDSLVIGPNSTDLLDDSQPFAGECVRSLLDEISEVTELTELWKATYTAFSRVRRIVAKKLTRAGSGGVQGKEALSRAMGELEQFAEVINFIFHERLKNLIHLKLEHAVTIVVAETTQVLEGPAESMPHPQSVNIGDPVVEAVDVAPLAAMFADTDSVSPAKYTEPSDLARTDSHSATLPIHTIRLQVAELTDQLQGRTPLLSRLAKLYENPVDALVKQVNTYVQALLSGRWHEHSAATIQSDLSSALLQSRQNLYDRLQSLLHQERSGKTEMASLDADLSIHISSSASLIIRLLAVLSVTPNITSEETEKGRQVVRQVIQQYYHPIIERQLTHLLQNSELVPIDGDGTSAPVSKQLMASLFLLSESVIKMGPSLLGDGLAVSVRSIMNTLKAVRQGASDACARSDVESIDSILASCQHGAGAMEITPPLDSIRLVLVPLLACLKYTEKGSTMYGSRVCLMAGPVTNQSQKEPIPIIPLAKRKVARFSTIPVT